MLVATYLWCKKVSGLAIFLALYCYRQHCAQRKAPVFKLLRGRFWGFSPRRDNTLHRWGWNLAWRRGHLYHCALYHFALYHFEEGTSISLPFTGIHYPFLHLCTCICIFRSSNKTEAFLALFFISLPLRVSLPFTGIHFCIYVHVFYVGSYYCGLFNSWLCFND